MKPITVCLFALSLTPLMSQAAGYTRTDLSSDEAGTAAYTDPLLKNPWGLSIPAEKRAGEAFWWAADNVTGVSTLYDPNGKTRQLVVTVPAADGKSTGTPTGTVAFNKNFVFVTEDGTISQWVYDEYVFGSGARRTNRQMVAAAHAPLPAGDASPNTMSNCSACHVTDAHLMHTDAAAAYEGVTVAKIGGTDTLLAANVNSATLEAYDASFKRVTLAAGAFTDPQLPTGYTATNVQTAGGMVWVVYVSDAGGGRVSGYSTAGKLLVRLQQGDWFDDPWGVAVTPKNFGTYSKAVLVGNVGSGRIAAFEKASGKFLGYLDDASGQPLSMPGLWAIAFGLGNRNNGPTNVLYFNAGGAAQDHGIFGAITASP